MQTHPYLWALHPIYPDPAIPEEKKSNPTQYNNDLEKSSQECPIYKTDGFEIEECRM